MIVTTKQIMAVMALTKILSRKQLSAAEREEAKRALLDLDPEANVEELEP